MKFPIVRLFGLPVAAFTLHETVQYIMDSVRQNGHISHADINTFKVVQMQEDPELRTCVAAADLISADGMGIVWAASLLGKKIPGRVTGIDLMQALIQEAAANNKSVYLLGAKQEVVAKVAQIYQNIYGADFVKGFHDGYFTAQDSARIAENIVQSGADFLFVGMNSPRKELFLYQNREILSRMAFVMGVGGSFDVISGMIPRAPVWIQKSGFEWVFRLSQEPVRLFKRYTIDNLRFLKVLFREWRHPA